MRFGKGLRGVPDWVVGALRAGAAASLLAPTVVILAWWIPALRLAYPFTLIPLLAAGPLAVRGLDLRRGMQAAVLAGSVAGLISSVAFATGSQALGISVFAFTSPPTLSPFPPLPQITIIPTAWMTWAQQDLLLAQIAVAPVLGLLGRYLDKCVARGAWLNRWMPASLGGRLRMTLGIMTALTCLVGWVGFSTLEDMHFRGHQLQLLSRWQSSLGQASIAFEAEVLSRETGADASAAATQVDTVLNGLASAQRFPGLASSADSLKATSQQYADVLAEARATHSAYAQAPSAQNAQHLRQVFAQLRAGIDAQAIGTVDTADTEHHMRLVTVLTVVGMAAAAALLVGQRLTDTINEPVRDLSDHFLHLAEGRFDRRVRARGPREMRQLASAVNHMTGELGRLSDVERRAFQEQLWHQAFHDPLTTLPNRALFRDRVEQAMVRAERHGRSVAVLLLDLDNFKLVNDSLGHASGDALLVAAASRLHEALSEGDTAARLGGDEFGALLEDLESEAEAVAAAEHVLKAFAPPFVVDGHDVFSSVSIGIAIGEPGTTRPDRLLRDADLAMYRAKLEGKAGYAVFDAQLESTASARLELETDLRRAVEREELRVVYQPIVSLQDERVTEFEALVRWQHPERGLVTPAEFIPNAEETGLIVPIGLWVLQEACRQVRDWQTALPYDRWPTMSVNLSARQFRQPTLVDDIRAAADLAGLEHRFLKLEITETAVMEDAEAALAILTELKQLGFQLAIDDFGTGYSSLTYLKRFPVDTLKIDRSFIDGLGTDVHDSAIVRSVIDLARSLGLSVTGEGVETPTQRMHLARAGCDRGQGYLFAKPAPAADVEAWYLGRAPYRRAA